MNKLDKVWEVQFETDRKDVRTKMSVVAKSKTSAIGKVAMQMSNSILNAWFRYKDCINITEQVKNGTYKG